MADIDSSKLSDEDLESALQQSAGLAPPTFDVDDKEEAAPEPEQEAPVPDPVPAESEPAKPDDQIPDVEAERLLLLQEIEAKAKHWESVAGRNAGELGFIKSQLKAIQAAQLASHQGEFPQQSEPEQGSTRPAVPVRDGLSEWAVQQAVAQTVNGFETSHPDVNDFKDKLVEYIKTSGYDMQTVMSMDNPIEAQREISRALEEAYWHTKAAILTSRRSELAAKREAIQTQAATQKMKASVSATGSSPPPKPKEKTVAEMTDTELEAELLRSSGGRW
jgi:hypothetical protein